MLFLEQVDSTNQYLKNLLSERKLSNEVAVYAGFQSAGRGQFGKNWISNPYENMLLSLAIDTHQRGYHIPQNAFALNAQTLCCILKMLEKELRHNSISLRIKWPNDIYICHQKIGGVLLETCKVHHQNWAIIGIGMNVNQIHFEQIQNVTSLSKETHIVYPVWELAYQIQKSIFKNLYYADNWISIYEEHLLCRDRFCNISIAGSTKKVKIKKVFPDGSIALQTADGISFNTTHHQHITWEV